MSVIDLDNLSAESNALLNATALDIRQEFNALIEGMSLPNADNIDWIVSSLASRNKYYSPLFIRCCRLALVKRVCEEDRDLHAVAVADRPLADLLRAYFRQHGDRVSVRCTESLVARAWRLLRPLRQFVIACVLLTLRCFGRERPGLVRPLPAGPVVLIDTFVLNNEAGDEGSIAGGVYKDRYYSGLWDQLTPEERASVFFLPTIVGFMNPRRAFRAIRGTDLPFVIHDDYLTVRDYLDILGHPFRVLRLDIPEVVFRGFNLRRLVTQERLRNCSDFISLLGLLYYRFADRLAQRKVQVRLLIDWHENQVIDRGMIAGFHRFYPQTKIVGYQGYVIATDLHIYTHPNRTERLGQAVPDVVAVTGEGLKEGIREFCPDLPVDVAPGFRFRKLWRDRQRWPDPCAYSVLVALPIDLGDSAHIMRLLFSEPSLLQDEGFRFSIKPHPTWSPDRIRQLVPGAWPSNVGFVTGDFHDCLETANLLVTNASSVSLEALAKGVPVIIVAPRTGILQNPIPAGIDHNWWSVCHDIVELGSAIRKFQKLAPEDLMVLERGGEEIRRAYFEPVTRETVARFLALN